MVLSRGYLWPTAEEDGKRVGEAEIEVSTTLELHAGERLVRVNTQFENRCRNHRLRAVFPLPQPSMTSQAECAFAIVERGLQAEGGPSEKGLPTFPSRRFVKAGGLTVMHEGLLEYELIEIDPERGAKALALTLLRATGVLSQIEMSYRPVPAGPHTPLEGPQMIGPLEARYALCVDEGDPYSMVEDAFVPLRATRSHGGGHRSASGSALSVEGAEVSSLRREAGCLEVRLFNPSPEPARVMIVGYDGWLVDLRGRPVRPFEETFELQAWEIATARLPHDS